MKRLIKYLPILMVALLFTGCGEKEETFRTPTQIKNSGTVNIAFSTDRYSFMTDELMDEATKTELKDTNKIYLEEEQLVGRLSEALKAKVNLIKTTKEDAVTQVMNGTADIAFGKINITEADKFKIKHTLAYAKDGIYIVTNRGVFATSINDLAGKAVALVAGSPVEKLVNSEILQLEGSVKKYKTLDTALEQLTLYNVDAIICYKPEAEKCMENNSGALQMASLTDDLYLNYAGVVNTNNEKLLVLVNSVIEEYLKPVKTTTEEE